MHRFAACALNSFSHKSCPQHFWVRVDDKPYSADLEVISVKFSHKIGPERNLLQTLIDDNDRRQALWQKDLRWYGSKVQDLIGESLQHMTSTEISGWVRT